MSHSLHTKTLFHNKGGNASEMKMSPPSDGHVNTSAMSASTKMPTMPHKNGKKKNGHKASCMCPICINMKHSKRGGGDVEDMDVEDDESSSDEDMDVDDDDESSSDEDMDIDDNKDDKDDKESKMDLSGGRRKKNGHKANCKCPICKNMKKSMKGGSKKYKKKNSTRKHKKHTIRKYKKRGGKSKKNSRKHR
jgi:hypothetical protein